jgi:hypothetical protein
MTDAGSGLCNAARGHAVGSYAKPAGAIHVCCQRTVAALALLLAVSPPNSSAWEPAVPPNTYRSKSFDSRPASHPTLSRNFPNKKEDCAHQSTLPGHTVLAVIESGAAAGEIACKGYTISAISESLAVHTPRDTPPRINHECILNQGPCNRDHLGDKGLNS